MGRIELGRKAIVRIGAAMILVIAIACAVVFQDTITRYRWSPRAPFDVIAPPPAPEYGARGAWLLQPDQPGLKRADVFYVHSTIYAGPKSWNAPITDESVDRARRDIAAPNQAGPFAEIGDIYAPRYREATLFTLFTHKYDGLAARELAYGDVRRAFAAFLLTRAQDRPIILVGYDQGGLHVSGLLREFFSGENNELRRRLAAAYIIGAGAPLQAFSGLNPPLPVCDRPNAVRCVNAWNDLEPRFDEEMARLRNRSLIWTNDGTLESVTGAPLVCVNPLTWRTDEVYAPSELNIGAASATGVGFSASPPALKGAVGARCDRGILVVDRPRQPYLRRGDWFGAKWRAQPFNLFFHDIAANLPQRLDALGALVEAEDQILAPIDQSVDIDASPVNKAPPL